MESIAWKSLGNICGFVDQGEFAKSSSLIPVMKRKTIYEYHSINKKTDLVRSNSAIVMRALPTCVSLTSCEECTTAQINFNCTWCDTVQRCSSGVDRHRQSWISNKCEENVVSILTLSPFNCEAHVMINTDNSIIVSSSLS